jgi:hypothetical protein
LYLNETVTFILETEVLVLWHHLQGIAFGGLLVSRRLTSYSLLTKALGVKKNLVFGQGLRRDALPIDQMPKIALPMRDELTPFQRMQRMQAHAVSLFSSTPAHAGAER